MNRENVNINSDFWVGVVEDNSSDPLKIGQCKVRIIGTHSFDATELPVEGLPWAIPTIPLNTSKTVSVPNVSDWVFGYFLDGPNKQMPIILGIMPGLINKTTYVKLTGQQQREYLEKIVSEAKPPTTIQSKEKVMPAESAPQQGEPTTPRTSRGQVEDTTLNTTNEMRAHSCDISFLTDSAVSKAKIAVKEIVILIRKGVKAALDALGISPGSSAIKSILDSIVKALKSINRFLNGIIADIAKLVEVIAKIRGVIDYILNLPEKLIALLQDCVDRLYETISKAAFEIVTGGIQEGTAEVPIDISSVTSQVNSILSEAQTLSSNINTLYSAPSQIIDTLYNPSGMTDKEVESLFSAAYDGFGKFNQQNYQPAIV